MRRAHRILGLLLLLPLLVWTGTGLIFLNQPGWAGAYESLQPFDERLVNAATLREPGELVLGGGWSRWELGSTALGPLYRLSGEGGAALVDAETGALLSPLSEEALAVIATDAAGRAEAKARYGRIERIEMSEREGLVHFEGGAQVRVGRYDLSLSQRGSDTVWIDRLYEAHYLRWTGVGWIDRILGPLALIAVWLLGFTGVRKLRRSFSSSAAEELPGAPGSAVEARRGELYWLEAEDAKSSSRHPHLVIQDDLFNRSRIGTVIVCALTSNLQRADEPGNVLLEIGEGALPRQSVIVVSQLLTVEMASLGERIGALSDERVEQVLDGIRFQQRSFFERSA